MTCAGPLGAEGRRLRRFVQVESPFASSSAEGYAINIAYARAAVLDSIRRGETPVATHLLFTQPGILREETERALGLELALDLLQRVDAVVVYTDRGVSDGMQAAIREAHRRGIVVEYRRVPRLFDTEHGPDRSTDFGFDRVLEEAQQRRRRGSETDDETSASAQGWSVSCNGAPPRLFPD